MQELLVNFEFCKEQRKGRFPGLEEKVKNKYIINLLVNIDFNRGFFFVIYKIFLILILEAIIDLIRV